MNLQTQKPAIRFRHHYLASGAILSICTKLNHEARSVDVGWAIFNPEDDRWIRKVGNQVARIRLENEPLKFVLTEDEPVICDYISMRALMVLLVAAKRVRIEDEIFKSPQIIPRYTLAEIQMEIVLVLNLLGQRVGLPSVFSE